MKEMMLMDKYPVFAITIAKEECKFDSVDAIIASLKETIEAHPVAAYIAIFDHYAHTSALEVGEISDSITEAKNIVFCFGKQLPKSEVMAVRPRSIGVAQTDKGFEISFMRAPNEEGNNAMISWVEGLKA